MVEKGKHAIMGGDVSRFPAIHCSTLLTVSTHEDVGVLVSEQRAGILQAIISSQFGDGDKAARLVCQNQFIWWVREYTVDPDHWLHYTRPCIQYVNG